ncbi:MAG: hypothetical protein IJS99_03855 [Synergistaceae bacterium]|nr:hypothetical protein [Synergistaceae bacterium]
MSKNHNKEYITREIFDANILAIREAMAASGARHERITAEMRVENERMRAEYRTAQTRIETRLDNIERSLDNFFKISGAALAGMTLLFTLLQIFLR